MRMTFAALAKTFNRFTSSTSSSFGSSSGSLLRSKTSSTPPTEEGSEAGEIRQERESSGKEVDGQVKDDVNHVDVGLTVEDQGKGQTEPGTSAAAAPASETAIELEDRTDENEKRAEPEVSNADADDEGEDMDISSSRGSTPEPIVVSREPLDGLIADIGPQTIHKVTPLACEVPTSTTLASGGLELEKDRHTTNSELKAVNRVPTLSRKITETELDQAKCLVLDLLGWGVSPEYLLERGISHALIYTVFLDLRLRLPDNIMNECRRLADVR